MLDSGADGGATQGDVPNRDVTEESGDQEAGSLADVVLAAGGIAHDLDQMLTLVSGYADLAMAQLRLEDADLGEVRKALEHISQAALSGREEVERLLFLSRGRPSGVPSLVDMGELIRQVAELTAPRWRDQTRAADAPVDLHADVPQEKLLISGWSTSLREALINLIFNAVDALPRGGTIRLVLGACASKVWVDVTDTGTGIPEEVRPHIFEPFFSTKGSGGTGLGLAVVARILERHAGTISVRATGAEGTTFRLKLPRVTPPSDSPPLPERKQSGLQVLVVDDDPALATMVSLMLQQEACTSDVATSVEGALEYMRSTRYDVLITDLGLGGGLSGWDLTREVRQQWPDTRVLLATGWGAAISLEEAQARGAHGVLAKPYRMEELWAAIQALH